MGLLHGIRRVGRGGRTGTECSPFLSGSGDYRTGVGRHLPQDRVFGESLTRIPPIGDFDPPRQVRGAVHGGSCHVHAMALIHLMYQRRRALSDDPILLEYRL